MVNDDTTEVRIWDETKAVTESPPIVWSVIPLLENEFPGVVFSNVGGTLTAGQRTFGRFETINDYRVNDCLVIRRSLAYVQKILFEFDGGQRSTVFDHRMAVGWRSLGIEPILEIESLISDERWWFVYGLHSSGEWMWSRMTPTTEIPSGVLTLYQLPRLYALCLYAGVVAFYYAAGTVMAFGLVMKLFE